LRCHFVVTKKDHFTKTGSGQTQEKHSKKTDTFFLTETMDGCLVHNDCLAMTANGSGGGGGSGGIILSFASVQACAAASCSHHIPGLRRKRFAMPFLH
jgi:hypothetical protein